MRFLSPLRYPGGKNKLSAFISEAIILNNLQEGTYVEPFAGGASVALHLLFNEQVKRVAINDIDRSIYAFWYSVLNHTEALCRLITDTPVNMVEWYKQKTVQTNKSEEELLNLGFSTFFLNRTNRSGIIKAGVIGGKEQAGKWKLDVRFNKDDLINRIEKIALYKNRIILRNQDVIDFVDDISEIVDDNTLIYFDPPYYNQGSSLYTNHYIHNDHEKLAKYIQSLNFKWILTYDYTPNIIDMYKEVERRLLTLNYTAANKRQGHEMLAFSNGFKIPDSKYSAISIE